MKSCEAALWNGLVAKWRLSHRLVTSDKATKTHHPPGPRSIKIHQDPSRSIKIHQDPSFVFFSLVPLLRHGGMEQYDHLGRWLWWGKSIKDHKRDIMDQWHTWCKHDTFLTPCWSCYDSLRRAEKAMNIWWTSLQVSAHSIPMQSILSSLHCPDIHAGITPGRVLHYFFEGLVVTSMRHVTCSWGFLDRW